MRKLTCRTCGEVKDADAFYKDPSKKYNHFRRYKCKDCSRIAYGRRWKDASSYDAKLFRLRTQRRRLARRYGMTLEDYYRMMAEQKERCKICNIHIDEVKDDFLCVDHCHKLNLVRGLLCRKCNTAIGMLDDKPALLKRAAEYVKFFGLIKLLTGKRSLRDK